MACDGAGACAGGSTVDCDALDAFCTDYACDGDDTCESTPQNVGDACDDGIAETTGDECQPTGACVGSSCPVPISLATWTSSDDGWTYLGNWVFLSSGGYPDGYMRFDDYPQEENYSAPLTSLPVDLTGCSTATLQYALMLADYKDIVSGREEYLHVQCSGDGSSWTTITWSMDGDDSESDWDLSFFWAIEEYTLPAACRTATAYVRFLAEGDDSWDIAGWGVDTVSVL